MLRKFCDIFNGLPNAASAHVAKSKKPEQIEYLLRP